MNIYMNVLRIHLILMRIRILDPHWKKIDPDPGNFQKIYWIFCFCLIFMLKLDEPFRNQEIFIISLSSIVEIWVFRENYIFAFFGWYFAPWIRTLKSSETEQIQTEGKRKNLTRAGVHIIPSNAIANVD